MGAPPSDAPCARERGAWLQPDQSLSGPKCVRRASHGLDGQAAPADIGKRVAAEQHQVGGILIDPERDLCSAIRISELDTSEGILVPLEVGKRVVEPIGLGCRKSYSVSSTACVAIGRPRLSDCSTVRAGVCKIRRSTTAVPRVRYG